MSELHDIDRRVAVLEQIAADTREVLQDIRAELRGLREDTNREIGGLRAEIGGLRTDMNRRFEANEARQWSNFRWLLGVMLGGYAGLFALIAHGLHWF